MKLIVLCDGNCSRDDVMSIGVRISETDREFKLRGKVSEEIGKLLGKGTEGQAKLLAVLEGLEAVKEGIITNQRYQNTEIITVTTDSQFVMDTVLSKNRIKNPVIWAINQKIQELRVFFLRENIDVKFLRWRKGLNEAYNISMRALYGDLYDSYLYDRKIKKEIRANKEREKDAILIPLSIFRKKEYANLTISESLVLELSDERKMNFMEIAQELGRAYDTIRTQYNRAKKKTAGLMPPRKLLRAVSNSD